MRIHETPERLRPPAINYPSHHTGPNIEEAFTAYAMKHAKEIDTPWIFLPVHWQNLYFHNERRSKTRDFYYDPEAQELVNNLDPKETYFTISQADEGTYETLPDNVKVFSAGGCGHYAIPLLTSPLPPIECKRDILASFVGVKECGGPVETGKKAQHSSWDENGRGAQVRRAVFEALQGKPGFHLEDTKGKHNDPNYINHYRDIMCRSVFALCPRGYGRTSFRLYEAIQLGAIPIYIGAPPIYVRDSFPCWLPFRDALAWEEFSIRYSYDELGIIKNHWGEHTFKARQIAAMQKRLREVYEQYFNLDVAPKRIAELVERVSR